jgi:hypothetical protein
MCNWTFSKHMVISQQKDRIDCDGNVTTTVEVVNMVDCTDMNHGANPGESELGTFMDFGEQAWDRNGNEEMGICNTTETNSIMYTVTDQKNETLKRCELTKASSELMRVTVLNRAQARASGRRREIKVHEISENGYGSRGSALDESGQLQTNQR